MRRLSGPSVGAARRDVLAVVDVDAISNDDDDYAAWVAQGALNKKGER